MVALRRVRRLAHSLKRDIEPEDDQVRFTNIDDVTHNHANPRAFLHHCFSGLPQHRIYLATKLPSHVSSGQFAAVD